MRRCSSSVEPSVILWAWGSPAQSHDPRNRKHSNLQRSDTIDLGAHYENKFLNTHTMFHVCLRIGMDRKCSSEPSSPTGVSSRQIVRPTTPYSKHTTQYTSQLCHMSAKELIPLMSKGQLCPTLSLCLDVKSMYTMYICMYMYMTMCAQEQH